MDDNYYKTITSNLYRFNLLGKEIVVVSFENEEKAHYYFFKQFFNSLNKYMPFDEAYQTFKGQYFNDLYKSDYINPNTSSNMKNMKTQYDDFFKRLEPIYLALIREKKIDDILGDL